MLCSGDAVRVIQAGGVYVNGRRVVETQLLMLPNEHILSNNLTLLRIGEFALSFVENDNYFPGPAARGGTNLTISIEIFNVCGG